MRRLIRRRDDRGVSAIAFALLAPVLVAAVGLSVDSGVATLQRANVQKAADSAAMAIGQDCAQASRQGATAAQVNRCTASAASASGQRMASANAPGSSFSAITSLNPGQGTVTVTVTNSIPMTFGAAVGVGPKTARASATVTWAQVPVAATTFPLALSICDYYRWKASPSSTHRLYRYDLYQGSLLGLLADSCTSPSGSPEFSARGAVWLVGAGAWFNDDRCTISTTIGVTNLISATNLLFPASCRNRADALVPGRTYLLPIYDSPSFVGLVATSLFPKIRGYAPFVITGWTIGGSLNTGLSENRDYSAPRCYEPFLFIFNLCRGIQGYFSGSIIPREEVDAYGTYPGADFGAVRVKLTN